jgi:hypothetical protein
MDEEVSTYEKLNGLFKVYLNRRGLIILSSHKEGFRHGSSIVMKTKNKTFKEKVKHIWNTQKNNLKNLFS